MLSLLFAKMVPINMHHNKFRMIVRSGEAEDVYKANR